MPLSYYIGPTGCAWSPLSCPRAESAPQGMAASVTPDDTDAQEDEEDDPYWDYPPSYTGQFAWWFENRLAAYEARLIGFPQRSSAFEGVAARSSNAREHHRAQNTQERARAARRAEH